MTTDSHIHVDGLPSSIAKPDSVWIIDSDDVVDYIKSNNFKTVELLYRNYSSLEYIQQQLPDIRIIGLLWVDLPISMSATKKTISVITEEMKKPLCYGIKIHDHRIWDKTLVSKEDYDKKYKYNNRYMRTLLCNLPVNTIVLMHIQGMGKSTPDVMLPYVIDFPQIKFIIGHAGAYGGMSASAPSSYKSAIYVTNYHQLSMSIITAIYMANRFHNVYLDNTMPDPTHPKLDIHKRTDKVIIGSDFGITAGLTTKRVAGWEKNLKKLIPGYDVEAMEKRFIDWIDTDWKVMYDQYSEHYEETKNDNI